MELESVVIPGCNNVEIPLEPCIVLCGKFEDEKVTVLVDGECNTNMLSSKFVERCREKLTAKLGKTDSIISHSRVGVQERATEGLQDGTLFLGKSAYQYKSNWLVGTARYDIILGMPWHCECQPAIEYRTREITFPHDRSDVILHEEPELSGYCKPVKVSSMSAKRFRRALRRNHIAELFHVTASNVKNRKSQRIEEHLERKLKGKDDPGNEEPFLRLQESHVGRPQVIEMLEQHRKIFRTRLPKGLPLTRDVDHRIETIEGAKPPFRRLYQLSPAELVAAKEYIAENVAAGKIRPSKSPYGSPMFFAKEKDGTLRGVVDYRGLNRITKLNKTAVPRTDEMLDRLGQARVFSKIDLKTGFHQIRIQPEDIEKTAFTTKYGQFEYTVMAMGLCNAPATFQTLMNSIFRDVIDKFLVVYLDDLLIFSNTEEEHEQHLELVLRRLKEKELYVSPKMCLLFKPEVEFLGLLAGKDGIRVDPAKIEVIKRWPRSENLTKLRGFMGLVQFFKRFLKNFSAVARPFTDLTKKEKGIAHWNESCTSVFRKLKEVLTNAPILVTPDWRKPFKLHVNASQYAVGGALTQEDAEGRTRVIAYSSKMLTPAEQNYTANDRELLALVTGLQGFRCYLEGSTFSVITDNQVVSHFFSKANLSRREARWLEILADFNISALQLQPGRINVLGDALSRIPEDKTRVELGNMAVMEVAEDDLLREKLGDYTSDQAFGAIMNTFDDIWHEDPKTQRRIEYLRLSFERKDGKLFYEGRLCLPRKAVVEVIEVAHDEKLSGHFGFAKTLGRLGNYHWKNKTRDVRQYCEGCKVCQQQKDHGGQKLNDPTALELPERRWGMVSTDFITYLPETARGYDSITTWVDRLSRRVQFVPSKASDTAEDAALAFFEHITPHHGFPDALISDRDPKFTSRFWRELMKLCGVKLKMASARYPQTDGASEVMNRVVENYLRCYCEHKMKDWDRMLPAPEFAYNSAVSEDLGVTSFEVDLGWRPRDPLDVLSGRRPLIQAVEDFKSQLDGAFTDAKYAHKLVKARQSASPELIIGLY